MNVKTDDRGVEYIENAETEDLQTGWMLCLTCGRAWNDEKSTSVTPVPSGRCPFEYEHEYEIRRTLPIFEETTSALYYSNDGRLRLDRVLENDSRVYLLRLDDVEVMRTHNRVLADAYIAGYDCALTTTEYPA